MLWLWYVLQMTKPVSTAVLSPPINGPVTPVVVPAFAKNPNLHSLDSTKDVPVVLCAASDETDGESSRFADTFEKLVVSIKDAAGKAQVDALGNPLIAIAPNPFELQGKSILTPEREDGTRNHAKIVGLIKEHDQEIEKNLDKLKFKVIYYSDK